MEKMIGLILIIAGIWVGIEFYNEGEDAFGGLLSGKSKPAAASASADEPPAKREWAGSRVKHSVERMHTDRAARIKERLGAD
jgi:hypothetical protein